MTDHEDTWTEHPTDCYCPRCGDPVTQKELVAESERVIAVLMKRQAKLAETIRDQLYHLNKTHTVALMAAELLASLVGQHKYSPEDAVHDAAALYGRVEEALKEESIAGSISA